MTIYLAITMFLGLVLSYTDLVNFKSIYFFIFILVLSILGMMYDPIKGFISYDMYTDLYRIFNELNMFRTYGWNADKLLQGTIDMTTNYAPIICAKVYMYICAKATDNNHVLVLANTMFTYGASALGLSYVGKKINASNAMIVSSFVTFVLINDYSRVIANIRMPLAMGLFILIWCIQINSEKNKIWYYLAYVFTCLLHSAMYIFLAIKFIVDFLPKKISKAFMIIMLISSLFLNSLINLLTRFSGSGGVVAGLLQKVILYSEDDTKVGLVGLESNFRVVILNMVRIVFFVFLIYCLEQMKNNDENQIKNNSKIVSLISFGKLITAFALGSIWSFHLFNRTVLFMIVIMPIYMLILSKEYDIRVLTFRRMNAFSILTWIFVLVNVMYYFLGYTYNQLVI